MIAPAQIVAVSGFPGVRWVVAEPVLSAAKPERIWRCVRRREDGSQTSRHVGDGDIAILENPAFEIGETVKVGARTGQVLSLLGLLVRVRLDPLPRPLAGGDFIITGGDPDIPVWQLVLENRL